MKITINAYAKKDGSLMAFVNGSNGASVGISGDGFSPYGKTATEGKRKVWTALFGKFNESGKEFTGDIAAHSETKVKLSENLYMLATDVANIGGQDTGSDGAFLVDVKTKKYLAFGIAY